MDSTTKMYIYISKYYLLSYLECQKEINRSQMNGVNPNY